MNPNKQFSIILEGTSHPGNLGATARAMKTMGLSDLRLVNTVSHEQSEAYARSSGADDILFKAKVYPSIQAATEDIQLLVGLSGRKRHHQSIYLTTEHHCMLNEHSHHQRVGFLFGNEQHGLDNQSLALCHAQMVIPTNPEFKSLNLASSVQIISYLCHTYQHSPQPNHGKTPMHASHDPEQQPANLQNIHALVAKLMALNTRHNSSLNPSQQAATERTLTQMLLKKQLSKQEADLIHGLLKKIPNLLPKTS